MRGGPFYAVCAAGMAVSLALTVAEAVASPAIKVGTVTHSKAGLVTTISADLTDEVGAARCPDVRVAALDSTARTLAEGHAQGLATTLAPHVATTYSGTITLTAKQYREKVSKYVVYVYADHKCP